MKLLMILNTPPPYQGTTIMNQFLLEALQEKQIDYIHLRIDSSKDLHSLGKLNVNKLWSAWHILKGIYINRKQCKTAYLVMSVEGFAFYRHTMFVLLLLALRKNCILHLRGLGFRNKKGIGRKLTAFIFKRSYLVQHSSYNSFDIESYQCKKIFYVPNGWADNYEKYSKEIEVRFCRESKDVNIVFLSNLIADKGLFILTESIRQISMDPGYKNLPVIFNFVGNWESEHVKTRFYEFINENKLADHIGHVGPLYNEEKYSFLAGMDILAFPTFYKHETWGNVILEAMIFKIPVIATKYVAIPEMVKDNVNGFLIGIRDVAALTGKLKILIADPEKRKSMGDKGRKLYLENFRLETFKSNIIRVIQNTNK